MSLSPGKREIGRLAKVLNEDYESVEEAAEAALVAAWELYEAAGKFAVVGQVYYDPDNGGWLNHEDAAASKFSLGYFRTEKQAQSAAESLVVSNQTGEEARAWVLRAHHGSPHEFYKQRKKEREEMKKKPVLTIAKESA